MTNGRGELLYSVGNGRGDDQAVVVELEGATVVREADLDLAGASIVTDTTADIENIEVKKNGKIQGNAANIRIAGSKIKLEVTDLSADNVTFVGNNTTLDVMNRQSSIKNVETDEDVICQLEMEEGLYANMSNPTVRGENGKLTRVDKTKDAVLEKLSIDQMPDKIAYSADETLDLTGLQIVETYRTSGIVEFTKDWEDGHLVETYTRLEANPLTNTAYSFKMKAQNVPAIGYKFKEADKGENTIVITKTDESTVISTEALKVVVLKDDEYAINYGGIDPQDITDYDLPRFYKKSNTISLNTSLTKTGYVFAGWYENNNIGPITGWQANTKEGSVSLYARWINMLYVDPDVTDDTGYGSYDKPFKMIEQAVGAITSTGSYTIVLMKDILSSEPIDLSKSFAVDIAIRPEFGTAQIGGCITTGTGETSFRNIAFTKTEQSLIACGDINLGGELSFAGKIDLAAGKKIILTDRIATDNPIVLALTSAEQKFQIIDGRSDYVSADGNKFSIDGTTWYLKNGQLRRYWYVDGESGDDNNLGSEDHPLKTVHKAVESAAAESIIYVRGQTEEDACMDILYDVEIYPWGYVDDESWTGGHTVIQRNCFGDDYQKSFIKVHENAKLKARYFEFNGNSKLVSVPMSHAAGITVAGGYIDIKHCIISRFTSIFYEDNVYNWGGPGGLSLYNMNETEKTIILEDLTIDSCHGYTMALAVGNSSHDDGSLTVEIGKNVNITGGCWDITEAVRPSTEYLPTVIRLDGKSSKLTLTKDIKLNTYFEDNNLTYNRNYLIDISAGVFTIDNCTLSLPEKPNNYSHILVNGIYAHTLRPGVHPKLKFRGSNQPTPPHNYDSNAKIYCYDDVAITLEGEGCKLTCDSMEDDYLNIISKNPGHGTAIEAIGIISR